MLPHPLRLLSAAMVPLALVACNPQRPAPPLPAPTAGQLGARLPRAAARAELDEMLAIVDEVHPNPYTVTPRDSLLRARDAIVAALPDPASRDEILRAGMQLMALIGDGHTNLYLNDVTLAAALGAGGRTLPFGVTRDADTLVVTRSLDPALSAGDRVLAINDVSSADWFTRLGREIPAELPEWRRTQVIAGFATRLWLHGVRAPYRVTVRTADGSTRTVTLDGATRAQIDSANRARPAQAAGGEAITYRRLSDGVAYLDFSRMPRDGDAFRIRLDSIFRQVDADSTRGVLIDLRRNGGGDSQRGNDLLGYLTTKTWYGGRKDWKMSARYRTYLRSQAKWWARWFPPSLIPGMGHKLFGPPAGTIVSSGWANQSPNPTPLYKPRPFCVLIGPGTFSSAMKTAQSIKVGQLAPLIGEPTGEPPNSFGEVYSFQLSRTGLRGQVSSALFAIDPDLEGGRRRGVLPDLEVRRSADDVRAGRDPALERGQQCVRDGGRLLPQ